MQRMRIGTIERSAKRGNQSQKAVRGIGRVIGGLAVGLSSACLLLVGKVEAIQVSFTKVVDTSTAIPGSSRNFNSFSGGGSFFTSPALSKGNVAFVGGYFTSSGRFRVNSQRPNITPRPATCTASGAIIVQEGPTTFICYISQRGLYTYINGFLNVVAETNREIDSTFANLRISDRTVFFNKFSTGRSSNPGLPIISFVGSYTSTGDNLVGGLYTSTDGLLRQIQVNTTDIPGLSAGAFSYSSQGDVAFIGSINFVQKGIYVDRDGFLEVVADTDTPIPGGTGNFTSFSASIIDNGSVAFRTDGSNRGIYIKEGNSLNLVADTNTVIPNLEHRKFDTFSAFSLSNGSVVFSSTSDSSPDFPAISGIYTYAGGTLRAVADTNTVIPNLEHRKFGNFSEFSLSNGTVVFRATSDSSPDFPAISGIYTYAGGTLRAVADTNTPVPNGMGNFTVFGQLSSDNGNVVFTGYSGNSNQNAIYTNFGGELAKVVTPGDSVDGKIVTSLSITRQAISGNQVVFIATFNDFSRGIYIATLEPTPAAPPAAPAPNLLQN